MPSLKLIFMGSPEFALPTFEALTASSHNVIAVYTQPPRPAGRGNKERLTPVHDYALSENLPVYTPASLKCKEEQNRFREHRADAAIVAAYGLLLPQAILEATRMGCINVHPSLLPRWRGAAPIQRTLIAGDRETGIVIMQMNAGLDTGDMLLIRREAIAEGTTAGMLHDHLARQAAPMVLQTLDGLQQNTIIPLKQSDEGVTYAKKITKEESRIDWKESSTAIRNKILGLNPLPCAYFLHQEEAIKILKASVVAHMGNAPPGTVLDNQLTIACGEDALQLHELQRPGKKPMSAREMLNGYAVPQGTVLE